MSDLGSLLKKARLERGISLEELQEITKIRIRYLQAIEEEDFSVLPGKFYVRAFIKSYAEAVGMDPQEVINIYQNLFPSHTEEEQPDLIRPNAKARTNRNTDNIARWASTLIVLSFLVLIAYVIYYFVLKNADPDQSLADDRPVVENTVPMMNNDNDTSDTTELQDNQSDTMSDEPEPVPEPELTFVATDGSTHIYTLTGANSTKLELHLPNGDCWVQVVKGSNEGEEITQNTYRKGDSDSWEVEGSLYIRLGNPRAATISVNGIEVEPDKLQSANPTNFQFNLVSSQSE